MDSKKRNTIGLPKLGKTLSFRPPLATPDIRDLKETFEPQLMKLIEQDHLSANEVTLSPRNSSSKEQFRQLGRHDSESFELDDLARSILPLWGFLRSKESLSYDPDELIAKVLELVVLIRRKEKAKAFGSRSNSSPDKTNKLTDKIAIDLQNLLNHVGDTELPQTIRLQLIKADRAFGRYHTSIKSLRNVYAKDEAKFRSIYKSLESMLGNKGLATQLINGLVADLEALGFLVDRKFSDGSWTKKIRSKEVYRAKTRL